MGRGDGVGVVEALPTGPRNGKLGKLVEMCQQLIMTLSMILPIYGVMLHSDVDRARKTAEELSPYPSRLAFANGKNYVLYIPDATVSL